MDKLKKARDKKNRKIKSKFKNEKDFFQNVLTSDFEKDNDLVGSKKIDSNLYVISFIDKELKPAFSIVERALKDFKFEEKEAENLIEDELKTAKVDFELIYSNLKELVLKCKLPKSKKVIVRKDRFLYSFEDLKAIKESVVKMNNLSIKIKELICS